MSIECKHGQLARKCNYCEWERDETEFRAEIATLQARIKKLEVAAGEYCEAQNHRWAAQSDEELYRANYGVEQAHDILAALLTKEGE